MRVSPEELIGRSETHALFGQGECGDCRSTDFRESYELLKELTRVGFATPENLLPPKELFPAIHGENALDLPILFTLFMCRETATRVLLSSFSYAGMKTLSLQCENRTLSIVFFCFVLLYTAPTTPPQKNRHVIPSLSSHLLIIHTTLTKKTMATIPRSPSTSVEIEPPQT